jgi:hypothetical protein
MLVYFVSILIFWLLKMFLVCLLLLNGQRAYTLNAVEYEKVELEFPTAHSNVKGIYTGKRSTNIELLECPIIRIDSCGLCCLFTSRDYLLGTTSGRSHC